MFFTPWQKGLRILFSSGPERCWTKSQPRSYRSYRPRLEQLEDRYVPSGYTTINLGVGTAYDLNNIGQVVGTMGVLNWQTGTSTGPTSGKGINDAGQVAGGYPQAYLWDPSTGTTHLGYLPGDTSSYANDLNIAGQVVGASEWGATGAYAGATSNAADNSHAFVWDATNGMQFLGPFPNRNYSTATGINDAGQVVGWAQASWGTPGQYQYNQLGFFRDNTGQTTLLTGLLGWSCSEARGINDLGQVVGSAGTDQTLPHSDVYVPEQAFLWQNGIATGLGAPAGYLRSEGWAINNAGQVVALAFTTTYSGTDIGHPFLWQNGVWTDLGFSYANSVNINNSGQILVAIQNGNSYLLNPVDPNAPTSFNVTDFPSPTIAGVAGSFTVTAVKADGSTATNYTGTIRFTSSDPQAVLPATYTFTTADAGIHTFTATLKTAGTQSITVTDATGTITGADGGITVQAATLSRLAVAGFPSPITAGVAGSFTVTAQDAYGNTVSGYTGTIHFTSNDPQAVLPANYSFTNADNGVHTFIATLKTAGAQSITATDILTASITGSEASILVNPAAASRLLITGPSSVNANTPFSIILTVLDAFGNVATGYRGTVAFRSSDASGTLPANYTFTAGDQGVHTFSGLKLKKRGTQTITVTDTLTPTLTVSLSLNVV